MEPPKAIDQMFSYVAVVHDPRRQHPTTLHSLEAILTITILATICGAHNWVEIEQWGHAHRPWPSEFLDLTYGIPSHDTFGRVLALLDPTAVPQAFTTWMSALANVAAEVLALDGKTIRHSLARADGTGAIHVVSARTSRHELVLAPLKVDDHSNETTALPELLALLNLHGRAVTIDAIECQVEIARQIVAQGGDYGLSLNENQPGLPSEGEELFEWHRGPHPLEQAVVLGYDAQVDGGHGRIETRLVWSTEALEGLSACERWPGLRTLVPVESTRQVAAQASMERRYYISSLPGTTDEDAKHLGGVIRTHWEIENRGHWVLDAAMGEDANRTRAGQSAQNLALIRKLALNLLRRETSVSVGIAAKQKRPGWDHDDLLKILAQT